MSWYYIASPSYWKWDTTKERLDFKKKSLLFIFFWLLFFFSSGGWFVIKIISKRWLKQHTWQDFSLAPMPLAAYLIIWDEGSLFSSVSPSWWVHRAMTTWLLVSQSIIKKKEKFTRIPISGRMWHRLCSCRLPLSFRLVPSRCGSRCRWLSTLPLRLLHGAVSYVK